MGSPARKKNASFKARIEDFEAEDVREFYDNMMMRVWYLEGKDRVFRIVRVQRITKQEGEEVERRAVLRLEDRNGPVPLPLELNPPTRDTIIKLYGPKKKNWVGRMIQLFPTTCEAFGETKECIRIRPYDPQTRMCTDPRTGTRTNRQGVHVLDRQPAPTAEEPAMRRGAEMHNQAQDALRRPAESFAPTGLELDDDDSADDTGGTNLDEGPQFTRNGYDDTEPPPVALETDR